MAKLVFVAFLAVALLASSTSARKFTRCQLVHELRKQGFPESKMRDWVCLVEHESGRDTGKVGTLNKNGSRDYGLFQINDRYWCSKTNKAGKDCHVTCADVKTSDITKAATCAKKIYKRHQFKAWYGWLNHCQSRSSLPDISSC